MTVKQSTQALSRDVFQRTGISLSFDDANTLRRAQLALHLWHEAECGDSNTYGAWIIERGDVGDGDGYGAPYLVRHHFRHGNGPDTVSRTRIPDREVGAIRRVADVCQRNGLAYYQQTDPRGCSLYVAAVAAGMTDSNYSTCGIACCD